MLLLRAISILFAIILLLLTACSYDSNAGQVDNVGMLVETTIHDQAWGQEGYKGLMSIQEEYGVDVYFKEGIKSYNQTAQAVDELVKEGAQVIFGHSSIYGKYFQKLHESYPDVHFIYFNGDFAAKNVTSLNFSANAMGFFGGMVAGKMTKSNHVAVIAAYEWQPEVEGFYEGVKYENPEAEVDISYVNSWDNSEKALVLYNQMKEHGADVYYPAGDQFNLAVIHAIQNDQQYAIGYVSDQSSLGKNTVLTSTVQKVDAVYNVAMDRLMQGKLPGKVVHFDFKDGAIALGNFSPQVSESYQQKIKTSVERYVKTGKLPNQ
ncbi:BMP family ABC transporter substrate-binding protein [Halobacillus salinarum]|uniref:BMP family ABC transporter substrate-binding protein n=1 Tax=Halobacillus salinarum TaxID=2932257 RepID=A0ABY4EHG9_9BACI|nr:BMP family ABC transporter substrate-binding protein [Halobacillus salinarum]UOQ43445.1 BMP family ABC transporter substrate-binding protein [Halobacillus salinarum]